MIGTLIGAVIYYLLVMKGFVALGNLPNPKWWIRANTVRLAHALRTWARLYTEAKKGEEEMRRELEMLIDE